MSADEELDKKQKLKELVAYFAHKGINESMSSVARIAIDELYKKKLGTVEELEKAEIRKNIKILKIRKELLDDDNGQQN